MSQRRTRPERTTGHGDLLENGEPIARVDYAINVMHFVLNTRAVGGGNQPREGIPSASGSFWVTDGVTVATAADDHAAGTGGPAGPVWRVYGRPGRVPLSDLPVSVPDGEPWDG